MIADQDSLRLSPISRIVADDLLKSYEPFRFLPSSLKSRFFDKTWERVCGKRQEIGVFLGSLDGLFSVYNGRKVGNAELISTIWTSGGLIGYELMIHQLRSNNIIFP